jgi:hypothetical protein
MGRVGFYFEHDGAGRIVLLPPVGPSLLPLGLCVSGRARAKEGVSRPPTLLAFLVQKYKN